MARDRPSFFQPSPGRGLPEGPGEGHKWIAVQPSSSSWRRHSPPEEGSGEVRPERLGEGAASGSPMHPSQTCPAFHQAAVFADSVPASHRRRSKNTRRTRFRAEKRVRGAGNAFPRPGNRFAGRETRPTSLETRYTSLETRSRRGKHVREPENASHPPGNASHPPGNLRAARITGNRACEHVPAARTLVDL
jgi:hypothetical protein